MEENRITGKAFFFACILGILLILVILLRSYFFNHTRVVFCDVGQGDGAYIRTKDKVDIVIDAGPGGQMAQCLGKYMPFYDRQIELAFLSHPQKDHYGGYQTILGHYSVERFITIPLDNDNKSFNELKKTLLSSSSYIVNLYRGDEVSISKDIKIRFVWPTKAFVIANSRANSIAQQKNQNSVLGAYTSSLDLNDYSETFIYSEGNFDILFTGDASPSLLGAISNDPALLQTVTNYKNESSTCNNKICLSYPNRLEILKVPHHGSKNGLTADFLKLADPMLSVISVAKKNGYGHPSRELLDMYQALKKQVVATKDKGDIVFIVNDDGTWEKQYVK